MILYHGSRQIIERPVYGVGNVNNDYGLAFYCTTDYALAGEWACTEDAPGYVNAYDFSLEGLSVLDLTEENYHVLNWLAILLENRVFDKNTQIAKEGYDYIMRHFSLEYKDFDVIKGYRADDSYFSFARAFLNNTISLEKLSEAMRLGKLGEQIAVKSQKAFDKLKFMEASKVEKEIYYPKKMARDIEARKSFAELKKENAYQGIYLVNILQDGWGNADVRL